MHIDEYLALAESLPEQELAGKLGIRDHFTILLKLKPEQILPLDNLVLNSGGLFTGIQDYSLPEVEMKDIIHTFIKEYVEKKADLPRRWNYIIPDVAFYISFLPKLFDISLINLELPVLEANVLERFFPEKVALRTTLQEKGFLDYNFTVYSCPADGGNRGKSFVVFLRDVVVPFLKEQKIPALFPAAYRGTLIKGDFDNVPRYEP